MYYTIRMSNLDSATQTVLEAFERTLEIPTQKPPRQFVLCPVGLIGAGKTTVMKPLSRRLSLMRISGDEIRKMLKENDQSYDAVLHITFSLAHKYLQLGHSIAIDSDCVSAEKQREFAAWQLRYHLKLIWIRIAPPEAFILKKLRSYDHTWLFRNAEHAIRNYFMRKPAHVHLPFPFAYTFDTSKRDLLEQIETAARVIERNVATDA